MRLPSNINPLVTSRNNMTRTWLDFNGDFIPQGDPLSTNPLLDGEYSGPVDPNFGKSIITTRYDPDLSQGWGKRPYNWEYSASVQHELLPRVSLEVGYFRRTFGNQTVTDNLDVTPADFDQFCITAPTDSSPGQCQRQSGVRPLRHQAREGRPREQPDHHVREELFRRHQPDLRRRRRQRERPADRALVPPGRVQHRADRHQELRVVDNPMTLRFCEVRQPFLGNYRVSGGYTFPWQIQVSGVFQSLPPDPVAGTGAAAGRSLWPITR